MKKTIQNIKAQKLEWHPDSVSMKWDKKAMTEYAKSLGKGWRVPEVWELLRAYHDKVPGFQSDNYWSSTTYADFSGSAWYVGFGSGYVGYDYKDNPYQVRCVR